MTIPFSHLAQEVRKRPPAAGLVLGSGWKQAVQRLRVVMDLPFIQVPGLSDTTVPGHEGQLVLGDWGQRRVLVFSGRLHAYEGHPWRTILRMVHVTFELGARVFVATNAAGGIRDDLGPGSVMAATDHIDWTRPLSWLKTKAEGIKPARSSPYSPRLLQVLAQVAREVGLPLQRGVYAQVLGPCYETPAEIRALRQCGADAVGMSTSREIQAAHEVGMECAALSCITNRAAGLGSGPLHHDEVLRIAGAQVEQRLEFLAQFLDCL